MSDSGSLLTSSENDTGVLERITLQAPSSGTLAVYVVVYGYNGAYSTSASYSLSATW
jgi:hypothetical protein